MRRQVPLDDEAAEMLLEGHKLADLGDLADLASVLDDIRSLDHGPVPPPSPTLTRILNMGAPEDARPLDSTGGTRNRATRTRRAAAKAPWAAVAAAVVLSVAATLDLLPRPAQRMVATAVSAVTPFELPGDPQHRTSPEGKADAEAGRAPGAANGPPKGTRSDARRPAPTSETEPGANGVAPPAPPTSVPNASSVRPTVPPMSAPRTSSPVRSSTASSVPATTVPVTPAPVVTSPHPPSSPQPSGGARPPERRSATLTGARVLPGPGDPDGAGAASMELDTEKAELCLTLTLSAVAPPTGIHLHQGAQGQTGPVVLELPPPAELGPPTSVCVTVPTNLSTRLRDDSAGYYLEVHTREFPDGALRGQLAT